MRLLVLEMHHFGDLGKGLAVEQHHVLAVDAACGVQRRQVDVHHRVDGRGRRDLAVHDAFERPQHRQHRVDFRNQADQPVDFHPGQFQVEPGDDVVPAAGRVQCRQVHAAGVGFGFQVFDLEAAVAGDQFGCQRVQAQIRIDAVVRAQVDLRIDIRRDHDQRTRCGGVVHAALFGDHLLQLFAVLGFGDRSLVGFRSVFVLCADGRGMDQFVEVQRIRFDVHFDLQLSPSE